MKYVKKKEGKELVAVEKTTGKKSGFYLFEIVLIWMLFHLVCNKYIHSTLLWDINIKETVTILFFIVFLIAKTDG